MLSPEGAPARTVRGWLQGEFELVVSRLLLEELRRACGYAKLRKRIEPEEADRFVAWLETAASVVTDPTNAPSIRSRDPGDDYLVALAEAEQAALVTGDQHLLRLPGDLPIFSPAAFLELLAKERGSQRL